MQARTEEEEDGIPFKWARNIWGFSAVLLPSLLAGNDKDKADCAIMTFKESDCDLQKLIGFYIDNVLPLSE